MDVGGSHPTDPLDTPASLPILADRILADRNGCFLVPSLSDSLREGHSLRHVMCR